MVSDVDRLELGNGRFEVIRIGCMRFERLSKNGNPCTDRWVGYFEHKDVDLPVFASSEKAFTVELISKCCEEIEEFLKAVEAEKKEPSSGISNVSPQPIVFITYDHNAKT